MGRYEVLKCDFHVHFAESYAEGPLKMIKTYKEMGYDCIALTEHERFILEPVLLAREYAKRKYGSDFIVIAGEETCFAFLQQFDNPPGIPDGGHLVGLFLQKHICSLIKTNMATEVISNEKGNLERIELNDVIEKIHEQGGLAILPHDHEVENHFGKGFWDFRKKYNLDGWEVGNGSGYEIKKKDGTNCFLSHPKETVEEGYIALSSSDAHDVEEARRLSDISSTYVFVEERSEEGIKNALRNRRTIAYCDKQLFGQDKWLDMFRNIKEGE